MNRNATSLQAGASADIEDFPAALAWSPDGRQLAVGGGEGRLYLVDAATGAAQLLGEVGRGTARDPAGTVRAMMRRLGVGTGL